MLYNTVDFLVRLVLCRQTLTAVGMYIVGQSLGWHVAFGIGLVIWASHIPDFK